METLIASARDGFENTKQVYNANQLWPQSLAPYLTADPPPSGGRPPAFGGSERVRGFGADTSPFCGLLSNPGLGVVDGVADQ